MSINLAVIEQIAEITLDQPEALNALSPADLAEFSCVLVKARDNPDVRVVLLKGAVERAFCTVANLTGTLPTETPFVNGFLSSREQSNESGNSSRLFALSSLRIDKPMIAVIYSYKTG